MAKSVIDKILVFTASTCGQGNNDLGLDSKEICLLAWQVINCGQIQVSDINVNLFPLFVIILY